MNKKPVTKLCTEMFKYIFFKKKKSHGRLRKVPVCAALREVEGICPLELPAQGQTHSKKDQSPFSE